MGFVSFISGTLHLQNWSFLSDISEILASTMKHWWVLRISISVNKKEAVDLHKHKFVTFPDGFVITAKFFSFGYYNFNYFVIYPYMFLV